MEIRQWFEIDDLVKAGLMAEPEKVQEACETHRTIKLNGNDPRTLIYDSPTGKAYAVLDYALVIAYLWKYDERLKELNSYFTLKDQISPKPERKQGRYQFCDGEANAIVEHLCGDMDRPYTVMVTGKKVKDVIALHSLIRGGQILPKESWDEPQMTPS